MLYSRSLLLSVFVASCFYGAHSANVTLFPTPIRITVADLPAPFDTPSVYKYPTIIPVPSDPHLSIPNGFSIKLYMSDLKGPRYLAYTPTGDILVNEPLEHRISCLLDTDNDGFPDQRRTIANASNGLRRPYGMAFANGFFYIGNENEIRRYLWNSESYQITGIGELVMTTNFIEAHPTRTIAIPSSADKIYVAVGSNTNHDPEDPPQATVQQANMDGSNQITFASGIRNPIGLTIHPITQELYVTCNERDGLGNDLVPDYFTRIQQGNFFGWPYAYLSPNLTDPNRRLPNGTSERPDLVAHTKTPDVLFVAHSAPMDIQFYTGKQFPNRYRNGAFVALHGSGNRNVGTGYKIVFVPFDNATNRPMGYYEDFVTGFLTDPAEVETFGRPMGLLVLKDGSLIFTDDGNGRIYQVQYNNCFKLGPSHLSIYFSLFFFHLLLCSLLFSLF